MKLRFALLIIPKVTRYMIMTVETYSSIKKITLAPTIERWVEQKGASSIKNQIFKRMQQKCYTILYRRDFICVKALRKEQIVAR